MRLQLGHSNEPNASLDEREMKEDHVNISNSPQPDNRRGGDAVQSAIGKRLKAYYDDVASEPVPDRFLSLLDALDAAESAAKGRGDA